LKLLRNHEKAAERLIEKKTAESFYDEAQKHYDGNDYKKSILFLNHAIGLKKDFAEAYFLKSKCLERLEEQSVNSQDLVNKANALVNVKQYSEAIEVYNKALLANSYALSGKGLALSILKEYHEALDCYTKSIQLNPEDTEALNNKGVVLYHLTRYEESLHFYDEAIKLDPKDKVAIINKGLSLFSLNKNNEAIQCYDKALEIDPDNKKALHNKVIAQGAVN